MGFDQLGLSAPVLKAVAEQGYDNPSPIQAQAIPAILTGKDVMAAAQTGTGKTAGFTLPLLDKLADGARPRANQVRALVLTPTRELAAQVSESVIKYGANLPLRSAVVFGGVKINPQMQKLRQGVDILVATPGRLLDLHTKNALKLDQLEVLVLDEADRMLDMGFINDIRKIIHLLPNRRQNLMFSATFSDEIRQLAKGLIHEPVEISVSPRNTTTKLVDQRVIPVDKPKKTALLIQLIKERQWYQVLVFCRTKHGANKLALKLNKSGISAAPIHGNKSQGARTRALAEFKSGDIQVLVATDIAARGLDIDQLPQVVNFDLPNVAEDYVHRIGRTGRAGAEGKAVSLVSGDEYKELVGIERLIQQTLPREEVAGFSPLDKLADPPKQLKPLKPKKPKKPRKPRSEHHDGARTGQGNARNKSQANAGNPSARSGGEKAGSQKNKARAKRPEGGRSNTNAPQRNASSGKNAGNAQRRPAR